MAVIFDGATHVPNSIGTEAGTSFSSNSTIPAPLDTAVRTYGCWVKLTANPIDWQGYNWQLIGCRTRTTTASFFNQFTDCLQIITDAETGLTYRARGVIGDTPIQHYNQTAGAVYAPLIPVGVPTYIAGEFNYNNSGNTPTSIVVYVGGVATTLALDGADTPHAISTNARRISIGGTAGTGSGGSDVAFLVGQVQWAYRHTGSFTAAQHSAMALGASPLNYLTAVTDDFYAMTDATDPTPNGTSGPGGGGVLNGNAAFATNFVNAQARGRQRLRQYTRKGIA